MAENTREIVLDILLELERGSQYSHQLLKAVLDKYNYLPGQEKAFIKRLTEGTLERRLELDYILNQYSSVPVRKMKPLIRCLMRMSVYQILYMDSVPDSAACNEAVKLAGKRKFTNLKGFVNGVLRNIAKNQTAIAYPDEEKNPVEAFSVRYSMPEWLITLWLEEYGREITEKLLKGLLEVHPVSIRFRTGLDKEAQLGYIAQMEKHGACAKASDYLPYAWLLTDIEGIAALPGYQEGIFAVQDVSSMLAVAAAGITAQDTVLDVCAAPGGKSMLAAELAARVIARDVSAAKVERMQENFDRMQLTNVTAQQQDASVIEEADIQSADVVLMDVPCSGLGVIGKKRDIKYNVSTESMDSIVQLQKSIIEACWQYVKPGGILLYSTCTIRLEENEEMVQWICENFPFEPVDISADIPTLLAKQKQEAAAACESNHKIPEEISQCSVQLLPGYMDTDGFFFAKLRRKA